jgi:hypothetical protein
MLPLVDAPQKYSGATSTCQPLVCAHAVRAAGSMKAAVTAPSTINRFIHVM